MLKVENVATPATAEMDAVPDRVPPLGFVPMARVTVPVKLVAVLPWLSRAVTTIAGVIAAPAVAALGCVVNTRTLAVPGVMLNAVLVAPVGPVAVALSV